MLDIVDVADPVDLVANVESESYVADAFHAEATNGVQSHKQQIVEVPRPDTAIAQIELSYVCGRKHKAIVTVCEHTFSGVHLGKLLDTLKARVNVASINDERHTVCESIQH